MLLNCDRQELRKVSQTRTVNVYQLSVPFWVPSCPQAPKETQQRTTENIALIFFWALISPHVKWEYTLVFIGSHRLSKNGNCACLDPPLCLSEQSGNVFTTILLVMWFLEALVVSSQPNHTWHTHLLKKGSGKWEGINVKIILKRSRDPRHGHNSHWSEEDWMYYEPFASNVVYSTFFCCMLDHLILQMLKKFLPSELRAGTSVYSQWKCIQRDAKTNLLFTRTNSCQLGKLPVVWH